MPEQTRSGVFRAEALEQFYAGEQGPSEVVRLSPAWLDWAYWLLMAAFGVLGLFILFGRLNQYASGPAVVRVEGTAAVTAQREGSVSAVLVTPGARVAAGDALLQLDGAEELRELERLESEFAVQLRQTLRDPADDVSRQALATLTAQRDAARARLEERTLRAPRSGVVSDLRVRPGQRLRPGEAAVAIAGESSRFGVVALLPGYHRPLLRAGMPLRLEVGGFRNVYQDLRIVSVGNAVIGPSEVRRYLGPEVADAVALQGPVVIVQADLPSATFVADGLPLRYFDGMLANADVRLRRESVLLLVFPWLRELFNTHGR